MLRSDYKWWYVKRDDNGFITEVAVRFYEGEYQAIEGESVYVRSAKLGAVAMPVARKGADIVDSASSYARKYTSADFGSIKDDDELRVFCNKELARDTSRAPIPEQLRTVL
jgi:hypothetical protein